MSTTDGAKIRGCAGAPVVEPGAAADAVTAPPLGRARYVMIGGFLGAGKTTAVLRLAQHLHAQGERVGLITNDQGGELVDSRVLRAQGFAVAEIAGGCFCCRFNSLKEAADGLRTLSGATPPNPPSARPTVFIAEPVGSCTDLVATVSYPLRRLYGDAFAIAPLSVLVDPLRCERVLGLASGARFSEKVLYIYRKQLEEADLIVINKADLIDAERTDRLRSALIAAFPRAQVLTMSARSGAGLDAWFDVLASRVQSDHAAMGVDYDTYADGEARLGWFNATWRIQASGISGISGIDGNRLVIDLLTTVQRHLADVEIAHLKATLAPGDGSGELASANLVRSDGRPESGQVLMDRLDAGELVLNLRAEAAPDRLRTAVEAAIVALAAGGDGNPGLQVVRAHLECFRPGRPVPTHRLATSEVL